MRRGLLLSMIAGFVGGAGAVSATLVKNKREEIVKMKDDRFKQQEFYGTLCQWVRLRQQGKRIDDWCIKNNYRTIAIYGMRELGELLVGEFKGSEVEVKYAIDRNAEDIYADVKMVRPEDSLEKVDAIIVTAIHWYEEIEIAMREKVDCPILSLDDILFEM